MPFAKDSTITSVHSEQCYFELVFRHSKILIKLLFYYKQFSYLCLLIQLQVKKVTAMWELFNHNEKK